MEIFSKYLVTKKIKIMKKLFIAFLLIKSLSINAQIYDRYNNTNYRQETNAYFKDIYNFQNQFEGTWIYQNGQERFEIKFRKREMVSKEEGTNHYYEDVLVGEYKYIDVAGVVKVNSIANLTIDYASIFDYNLYSGHKKRNNSDPICTDCPVGTERLYVFFDEQGNDDFGLRAALIIRRVVENGVEKIIAQLENVSNASNENKADLDQPSVFIAFSVPYGFYTLIKQ